MTSADVTFTGFERAVITKALAGSHPTLISLRAQFATATAVSRELTGVGFYVGVSVGPASVAIAGKKNVEIGDVFLRSLDLKHGAGFVLFIRDGFIKLLEGYTFDEPWPAEIVDYELAYVQGAERTATIHELDQAMLEGSRAADP